MGVYKGSGSLTREQFLFHETRIVAKLMTDDKLDDLDIIERVISDNLFQFPTERMIKNIASVCLKRLHSLNDKTLIEAVAHESSEVAKQICLYSIMKCNRLLYEFMVTVIGSKYATKDYSFGNIDLNVFFMRLQEQDDDVAGWSDSTIKKIKQVIRRILVETEYIDDTKTDHLNLVWLNPILEDALEEKGETEVLKSFNYFL